MSDSNVQTVPAGIQRVLEKVADVVIYIAVAALLGLVVVQGWQALARYVINDSPSWTEPVTLLLLSTTMSMGAAAGVYTNRHFGFFLLAEQMHPLVKRLIDALVPLIVGTIGAFLAWWGLGAVAGRPAHQDRRRQPAAERELPAVEHRWCADGGVRTQSPAVVAARWRRQDRQRC